MLKLRTQLTGHCLWLLFLLSTDAFSAEGKLIGTAGLSQIEGAGGGGLVPWATLSGYDSQDQVSASGAVTVVDVDDYRLNGFGISASFYDRAEVSVAHQRLDLKSLGGTIRQNIVGFKFRLSGDVVYSEWPQISAGLQHKRLSDNTIANALGADDDQGTDFYLAAAKVHLGAIGGYNAVWNVTARATKANEMGLLGFGGSQNSDYELQLEASAGILLSRHVAVGVEYRQKPDNLGLGEDDWVDAFISYIPSKSVSITAATADLGSIAGAPGQSGFYLSLNAQLW